MQSEPQPSLLGPHAATQIVIAFNSYPANVDNMVSF